MQQVISYLVDNPTALYIAVGLLVYVLAVFSTLLFFEYQK